MNKVRYYIIGWGDFIKLNKNSAKVQKVKANALNTNG